MHFSITIIRVSKSKKMRWARHSHEGEMCMQGYGGEALSSKPTWNT